MTVNEALVKMYGMNFDVALKTYGHEGVRCALRATLVKAAEEALDFGGPSGGTEIRLSVLADKMGHLALALYGLGDEPSSIDR